jgi:F-type H+-transporting ATPase subunit delta
VEGGAVAKRYAAALFAVAQQRTALQQLDAEAKLLAQAFDDPQIRRFASDPQIPEAQKKQVLADSLGERFDPALKNLIRLLVDKKRITLLPAILRWFDRMTDVASGIENVTIVSAVPLTEQQQKDIVQHATHFSAYGELRVETKVDPKLLGGVEVRLGENLVLDGSVASRLRTLRDRLYKYRHRGLGA